MKVCSVVCLILILFAYCGLSTADAAPTKVGVIIPLTGPAVLVGDSLRGVVQFANPEHIKVIFEDDRCDGKLALAAYLKLREEGVRVFYLACSGSILALAPHIKRNGDLLLTAYAGSSRIRDTGDEVIRLNPDAISIADSSAALISGAERPVAVLYEEQEYASSLVDRMEKILGKDLIKKVVYRPEAPSFSAEILSIQAAKPKSIFIIPVGDAAARIILKQLAEYKVNVPILGEVNLCDFTFKPADYGMHGVCVAARFRGEDFTKFIEDYTKAIGHAPAYPFYDAITYDLFKFIDRTAVSSPNLSVEKLKMSILAGFKGEFTNYQFSPDGEISNSSDYLVTVTY